ncbi:hypothetical protein ACFFUP_18580 [Vibrio ostreicida]|uniref:Amino acid ABC transporter substrate-binding protein n=1 Tax=Vibrio ostreicida TaxID=526588 RepID=A0ABT8BRW5_9VIBR|nr:hypothetical protein [Vibrio ostreicida]MDN3608860.1 hypothetical protein [Vibrio ostreicida]NPD09894.1 hypothetical protein [Vibrio ostreicida]
MKKRLFSYLIFLCSLLSPLAMAQTTIVHPIPREGSELDLYTIALIKFLVEKSGQDIKLQPYKAPVDSQSRKVNLLKEGKLTIDWLGADKTLEKELLPIRYPVFRGLLGHRIFITNKTIAAKLGSIDNIEQLQQLGIIQGEGWADVNVLKSGGFKVREVPNFDNIFRIVDSGRTDLFPRAVIEPYSEVAQRSQLTNLVVDDKVMLIYRFPMFLFVSPTNPDIAKLMQETFEKSYQDGSFEAFFEQAPLVVKTFEQAGIRNRKAFKIDNPHLSDETRSIPEQYWLNVTE